MDFTPGDPARMILGEYASQEEVDALREEMGLNENFFVRYFTYMKDALTGDLGKSYRTNLPVAQELMTRFPNTLVLAFFGIGLAVVIGVPIGILSAVKQYTIIDTISLGVALIMTSIPAFWLGLMLLLIFYRDLGILPGSGRLDIYTIEPPSVTGMYTLDALISGDMEAFRDALAHLILPAFCLGYIYLAIITRIVRSSMLHSLEQDYVTTARANGLSEARVIGLHALRNSLIPTITIAGLSMGELMGGAILTETIFDWPGMGKYVVDSVNALDFPAIMGFTLVVALAYIFINLCVDVLYAVVNPQIRYRSGS